MQIHKKETYLHIISDENSFKELYNWFLKEEIKLRKEHIILQISEDIKANTKDFLLFLNIAEQKQENGTSFVVIYSEIDADDFPENLNIVPTLQEAEDILEMENIERELGF